MGCGASSSVVPVKMCPLPNFASTTTIPFVPIPLSTEKKRLVRDSWLLVEPVKVQAGKKLFARLFEINPDLQDTFPAFKGKELKDVLNSRSLYLHGKRVMGAVENAVMALDDAETFTSYLVNLGIRHKPWGITREHFNGVGEALIWTLQDMLSTACTTEVTEAWADLYGFVVESMLTGVQKTVTYR